MRKALFCALLGLTLTGLASAQPAPPWLEVLRQAGLNPYQWQPQPQPGYYPQPQPGYYPQQPGYYPQQPGYYNGYYGPYYNPDHWVGTPNQRTIDNPGTNWNPDGSWNPNGYQPAPPVGP